MGTIQFQALLVCLNHANDIVQLKNSGDKASPHFKPFLIIDRSDKCLPIQTVLQVSFKHILISLTCSIEMPTSLRMLYQMCLLTE
jgi:hypothetical protein